MKCKCGCELQELPTKGYIHVKWNGKYWKAYYEGNDGCNNPVPVDVTEAKR